MLSVLGQGLQQTSIADVQRHLRLCVCALQRRPVRLSVALYLEDNQGRAVPHLLRQCDGGYQRIPKEKFGGSKWFANEKD